MAHPALRGLGHALRRHPARLRAGGRNTAPSAEITLQGKRGWHYWMPGVAVNRHGDVAVTFVRSRTNKFVSAAAAMLPAGAGQFSKAKRLISGRCALPDGGDPGYGQPAQPDPFDDDAFWFVGPYAQLQAGSCAWGSRIALAVADGTHPPAPIVLASGQLSLPSTTQFSGPGFHQPFEIAATLPAGLDTTTGKRLVLRLRDQGRPAIQCGSEHPLSGCGTIDYSCPDIALDDRLVLPIAGGTPRTYHLSDAQLLVDKKVVRSG